MRIKIITFLKKEKEKLIENKNIKFEKERQNALTFLNSPMSAMDIAMYNTQNCIMYFDINYHTHLTEEQIKRRYLIYYRKMGLITPDEFNAYDCIIARNERQKTR